MRITAAILLGGCLAAASVAAQGQTTILPPAATLNPHDDAAAGRSDALRPDLLANRGESAGVSSGAAVHVVERGRRGEARPPRGRLCFNQAEAREAIAAHRLIDPVRALRVGRQQGDALSARMCRWPPEEFVYEVSVLRRDGRILRLFMNARNGDMVGGQSQTGQAQAVPVGQAGPAAPLPAGGRVTGSDR